MTLFFFKRALMSLRSAGVVTVQSLLSIVLGVLGTCFILVWTEHELSADRFHKRVDDIYVTAARPNAAVARGAIAVTDFFGVDLASYPEIERYTTIRRYDRDMMRCYYKGVEFTASAVVTDSSFFDFFDFPLRVGDKQTVLKDRHNMVITAGFARRMFGDEDPVGKEVNVQCDHNITFQVAAIMEDVPSNSSLQFDFVIPEHAARFWGSRGANLIMGNNGFDVDTFNDKIAALCREHPQFKEGTLSVVSFTSMYFGHPFSHLFTRSGDRKVVELMGGIGIILFLISLLNFVNLQAISFSGKVRVLAISRAMGASKKDIVWQVVMEQLLFVVGAVPLVLFLYGALLPVFNSFLHLTVPFALPEALLLMCGLALVFVTLSLIVSLIQFFRLALYPVLRDRRPLLMGMVGKQTLIVFQFAFTIFSLIATLVVFMQLRFMLGKDLGYDARNVVNVHFFHRTPFFELTPEQLEAQREQQESNYAFVKQELQRYAGISMFAKGQPPIGNTGNLHPWKAVNGDADYADMNIMVIEPGFDRLLGLTLKEGRFFQDSLDKERSQRIVINEAARAALGLEAGNAVGQMAANTYWGGDKKPWEVIGVMGDFHFQDLSHKIEPLIILYFEDMEANFLIRINDGATAGALEFLEGLYKHVNPEGTFTYTFLEDDIRAQYEKERQMSTLYLVFSIVATFISCLGLFTLSMHQTLRRTKEIGVRRVNGAHVWQVAVMLNVSIVKWVLIAFVLAGPVAWYVMDSWLAGYANRIPLSGGIFLSAGVLVVGIALLTVSWQTWRAATRNPVEALRYE